MRFFKQSFHLEISSYSSDDLLNTCRICRDETVRESLISPCRCSGTLGKCHVHCLEKWLSRANKDSCEICGHVYQTMRLPRSFKEVSSTRVKTTCVLTNIYEPFKLQFVLRFYWEAAWPSSLGRWCCNPEVPGSSRVEALNQDAYTHKKDLHLHPYIYWNHLKLEFHVTTKTQLARRTGEIFCVFWRTEAKVRRARSARVACEAGSANSHAIRTSRSPRFRLWSPELRKKLRLFCRLKRNRVLVRETHVSTFPQPLDCIWSAIASIYWSSVLFHSGLLKARAILNAAISLVTCYASWSWAHWWSRARISAPKEPGTTWSWQIHGLGRGW